MALVIGTEPTHHQPHRPVGELSQLSGPSRQVRQYGHLLVRPAATEPAPMPIAPVRQPTNAGREWLQAYKPRAEQIDFGPDSLRERVSGFVDKVRGLRPRARVALGVVAAAAAVTAFGVPKLQGEGLVVPSRAAVASAQPNLTPAAPDVTDSKFGSGYDKVWTEQNRHQPQVLAELPVPGESDRSIYVYKTETGLSPAENLAAGLQNAANSTRLPDGQDGYLLDHVTPDARQAVQDFQTTLGHPATFEVLDPDLVVQTQTDTGFTLNSEVVVTPIVQMLRPTEGTPHVAAQLDFTVNENGLAELAGVSFTSIDQPTNPDPMGD